jgi:hypothetical protein
MKTFGELCALIELVVAPGFDSTVAQQKWGPIVSWLGQRARFERGEPGLDDPMLETLDGEVRGLQTGIVPPVRVEWEQTIQTLGSPVDEFIAVDDFGGPTVYQFARSPSGSPAMVMLKIRREEREAVIEGLVVRHKRPAISPTPEMSEAKHAIGTDVRTTK